jgi:hypothetical protein
MKKKNTEALLKTTSEVYIEEHAEKAKFIIFYENSVSLKSQRRLQLWKT